MKDFIHVTSVIRLPSLLAVHPSLPVHNVAELITLAKEKPGALSYASAGVGNFSHLEAELFAQAAGMKLVHVPYKGTGPSALGLIGGEVQLSFNNVSTLVALRTSRRSWSRSRSWNPSACRICPMSRRLPRPSPASTWRRGSASSCPPACPSRSSTA